MKKSRLCMTAILSSMLLTSCISERIVYRTCVPEISFPPFPTLEGERITEEGILVPADWFVSLAEYRIRIEETEKNYGDIKALYDNEPDKSRKE